MVKFVVAGPVNCPYFAKIEVLAQVLKKTLPDFDYRPMLISASEWSNFVEDTCKSNGWIKQTKSPLIWREPLEFGGPKLYFGSFNEFQEYAYTYYNMRLDLSSCEMQMLAESNIKDRVKETVVDFSATTDIVVSIIFATSPISYFFLPQLAEGDILSPNHLIDVRLYDISKSQEVNHKNIESVLAELENCSYAKLKGVSLTQSLQEALTGAHVVVIFPCKTVLDDLLLEPHFRKVGKAIREFALEEAKVLVVYECIHAVDMNMCDLRLALSMNLSFERILAITGTIQERGKRLLAEKMNIHPVQITNLLFWGFNSKNIDNFSFDIEFATVENCIISSIYCPNVKSHVSRLTPNDLWLQKNFPKLASGHLHAKVNEVSSIQNAMSMASKAADILRMWWNGSGGNHMHSICMPSRQTYGVDQGIFFSFPVLFRKAGEISVVDILPVELSILQKVEKIKLNYVAEMVEALYKRIDEVTFYLSTLSKEAFSDEPSEYPPPLIASETLIETIDSARVFSSIEQMFMLRNGFSLLLLS